MRKIEFTNPHRKKHFEYFKGMNHPHYSITANVDISKFLEHIKDHNLKFTPSIVFQICATAHKIKPFLQRIRGNEVVEHEYAHPSFSVSTKASDVFSFCEVKYYGEFQDFYSRALQRIKLMQEEPVFEDEGERDDYLFLSAIPWVSFTSISHAMHYHPHDCIPRISWGKHFEDGNKTMMQLSLTGHHALIDGKNMGDFFNTFQEQIEL